MINIIYFKGKSNFINLYILIPRYASEPSPQAFTVRTFLRIWTFAYFTDKSLCTRPRFPGLPGKRIPAYNLQWNSYYPRESQNFWRLFQWFLDSGWKGMFTYFTVHIVFIWFACSPLGSWLSECTCLMFAVRSLRQLSFRISAGGQRS